MAPRVLQAGPLSAELRGPDLWHIRFGAVETVERIYVAVRDRNWGTPPGRVESLQVEEHSDGFRVVFDCIHQHDDVDFRWRGTIAGTADGTVSFAMDGQAHSTFLRNRVGICVHHPLRACSGQPCTIEHPNGSKDASNFPILVSPHQPFRNIRGMTYEVADLRTELRLTGDIFETEDHRNWTDANFKTYSTPLDLPFPVEVVAGTEIRQQVDIAFAPCVPVVQVRSGSHAVPLPKTGLTLARHPMTKEEADALRRLRLSHVRADTPLDRASYAAEAIDAKLEAVVTLPVDMADLREFAPHVDRWLVFSKDEKATGANAARKLREVLGPDAAIIVGTDEDFAELNRNRPGDDGWDGACFSLNPQVHAFDDESTMANTAAQFDAVRSAHGFLNGKGVVVSPVTLRPRSELGQPDPRHRLPFCAAWTVASLQALASAGASSITYFETHGPAGVVDGSTTYPVYSVFEAIAEAKGTYTPCVVSDPSRVAALAFETSYLIANLTPEPCRVVLDGSVEARTLAPYEVVKEPRKWT